MSEVVLNVRPTEMGWRLESNLPLEPIYFRSGARIEAAARDMARRLSERGLDVQLVINDRANQLIATRRYLAA